MIRDRRWSFFSWQCSSWFLTAKFAGWVWLLPFLQRLHHSSGSVSIVKGWLWMQSCLGAPLPVFLLVSSGCPNKIPRTGGFNNRNVFSHTSGGWEAQNQVASRVGFLVRTLFLACRWLPSPCVLTRQAERARGQGRDRDREKRDLSLLLRRQFCQIKAPPLWPHLTLITS